MASKINSLLHYKLFVLIALAFYCVHCDTLCDISNSRPIYCNCENAVYLCAVYKQPNQSSWIFPNSTSGLEFKLSSSIGSVGSLGFGKNLFEISAPLIVSRLSPNLQKFEVSDFNLTKLDTNFIHDRPNLTSIILSNCYINSIETGAFANLPKLTSVQIQSSSVQHIHPFMFNSTATEELNLNDNLVEHIDTHAFSGLNFLTYLSLDGNRIRSIQFGAFRELPALKELYLRHNAITMIESDSFITSPRLKFIDLSHNLLEAVNLEAFNELEMLSLDLSDNQLKQIPSTMLAWPFAKLDLKNNSIRTIRNVNDDVVLDLELDDNPLSCDCDMSWILNESKFRFNTKLYHYLHALNCTVKDFDKYKMEKANQTYESFFQHDSIQAICSLKDSSSASESSLKTKFTLDTILIICVQILF